MESPVVPRCQRCQGQVIGKADADTIAQELQSEGAQADNHLDGLLREQNRRKFLATALASFTAGLVANALGERLGIGIGNTAADERERAATLARLVTAADMQYLEDAIGKGVDLARFAEDVAESGRYALAQLARAISDHVTGANPKAADDALGAVIAHTDADIVLEYCHFRRAKARCVLGELGGAMDDLRLAVTLSGKRPDSRARSRYLRQMANQAYIALPPDGVLVPDRWTVLDRVLAEAEDATGVNFGDDDLTRLSARAVGHDAFVGPGLLCFVALRRAATSYAQQDDPLRYLEWHLELVRLTQQGDVVTGWNRYSPLAAQAIHFGQYAFARRVLDEARHWTSQSAADGVAGYAKLQRATEGTEWLWHRFMTAALDVQLARDARREVAREHYRVALAELEEPLLEPNAGKVLPLLRAAQLYRREALAATTGQDTQMELVGAYMPAVWTHWAYIPRPRVWPGAV